MSIETERVIFSTVMFDPKLTNKEAEFYFVILNSNPSFVLVYSPYVSQLAAFLLAIHLKRLA